MANFVKKSMALGVMSLFLATSAMADFSIIQPKKDPDEFAIPKGMVKIVDNGYRSVIEVGNGRATVLTDTFGDSIDFSLALSFLVPDEWKLWISPDLIVSEPVSWLGGMTWLQELEGLGNEHNIQFVVYWDEQTVLARPGSDVKYSKLIHSAPSEINNQFRVVSRESLTKSPDLNSPEFVLDPSSPNKGTLYIKSNGEFYEVTEQ